VAKADTPQEAAQKALASLRRPDTTATIFCVTDPDGQISKVDLGPLDDASVILLLHDALVHAMTRLNQIPHRYEDTDFRLIRNALRAGGQHMKGHEA
jgi:hypothetical protein